jgi:8-oxo-dGTP diphosphatase
MSAETFYRYCPQCGQPLQLKEFDERLRPYCPPCNRLYFEDPKVAAAVLIEDREEVLLVRRAVTPQKGKWTLPAGFVDAREDPIDAAVRECLEETGLKVRILGLIDLISGREHEHGADIVLLYRGKIVGGELKSGSDVSEVAFFSRDQLPPLAFRATKTALSIWQASTSEIS